jgi:hypothetical protein
MEADSTALVLFQRKLLAAPVRVLAFEEDNSAKFLYVGIVFLFSQFKSVLIENHLRRNGIATDSARHQWWGSAAGVGGRSPLPFCYLGR